MIDGNSNGRAAAAKSAMLSKLRTSTTGLDVEYTVASGQKTRRVYLDSTASTLKLGIVRDVMKKYMPYYANTHNNVHFGAKLSTREFEWAHDMVLSFVDADPDKVRRTGALAFNIKDFDHSLTAAILNDYFNIAVRNACFCAHPYVREMITDELSTYADELSNEELEALAELHRGMVRASFGLYNDEFDVDALVSALRQICSNKEFYQNEYHKEACGEYHHKTFVFDSTPIFSAKDEVNHWFGV